MLKTFDLMRCICLFVASCLITLFFRTGTTDVRAQTWRISLPFSVNTIALNPASRGKVIFAASTDSPGVYRTDDGGTRWRHLKDGLPTLISANIQKLLVLESDTNIVLAASANQGVFRSTDGGEHWSHPLDTVGQALSEDREKNIIYYPTTYLGPLSQSYDHGATWHSVGDSTSGIFVCSSAARNGIVLSGGNRGAVARSTDRGATWRETLSLGRDSISIHGHDTVFLTNAETPVVLFCANTPTTALATRWPLPVHDLLESTDAGQTWDTISAPGRIWALALDAQVSQIKNERPQHLFVGLFNVKPDTLSSGIVAETMDGGQHWSSTGFPDVSVRQIWQLQYDTTNASLFAATGNGVFKYSNQNGIQDIPPVPSDARLLANPFGDELVIEQKVQAPAEVKIFNEAGSEVRTLSFAETNDLRIDTRSWVSGIYLIEVRPKNKPFFFLRGIRQ